MAERNKDQAKLRLVIRGEGFRRGDVPVSILASKLQAVQNLIFHAAAAVRKDRAPRRGQWQNRYREFAELSFVECHHSDLTIEMELPPAAYINKKFDQAPATIDLLFGLGQAIQADAPNLDKLQLSRDDQGYLLRALEWLAPGAFDNYQIELSNGTAGRHTKFTLTPESREVVRQFLLLDTPVLDEPVVLVGEVVKIHVDIGPKIIAIRYRDMEIPCYYPEHLRDQVANLIAGSMVEVRGFATLDAERHIKSVDEILDVEPVSMDPLRLTRFEHAGIRHQLQKPVIVTVSYVDGLWVYRNDALNLWGYGERREDALHDLHANFTYLWREFAEEKDALLDSKAKALRQALLHLK